MRVADMRELCLICRLHVSTTCQDVQVEERLVQRWIPGKIGGVESGGKE